MPARLLAKLMLWCDGRECRGKYRGAHPEVIEANTMAEVTAKAHRLGWSKRAEDWICPICTRAAQQQPAPVR